jgi:RNA polymerase sigma factor (sigma-70 family)
VAYSRSSDPMGSVSYFIKSPGRANEFVNGLVRAHGAQLQRFLMRMLGRRELAEEVAQETYLKLYRLSRPEEVACPQALLFDVATKLAITHLRRTRAETARAASAVDMEELPDEWSRPDRRAMAAQAMQRLTQIIEELPPNLREVFVMRYVQQMARPEIAQQLNISVNAIEQRLTRALVVCRTRLVALGIDWLGAD